MADTCISFTYESNTLNMRGANFNDTRSVQRVQARSRTHDGILLVGDRELTLLRFILTFSMLNDTERESLEDFFGPDQVNGSLNTFTYIDENGASYAVNLLTDPLDYVNTFTNLWTVDMILEQVDEDTES